MYFVHITIRELLSIIYRRKRLLVIPPILVTVICVIGAFALPRKYESYTTILIQRDEVLNPLIRYDMAIALASDDRMTAFEEIIYSRGTIQALIDSLHLEGGVTTEADRQAQIRLMRGNISIGRPSDASFSVSFAGSDPVLVQQAVAFLARQSIRTMIKVENQRNDLTVQFFEDKLLEYQQKFERSRQTLVPLLQERVTVTPLELNASRHLENINDEFQKIDARIRDYKEGLNVLRTFPEALGTTQGRQVLLELQRTDLPFMDDLRPLLTRYNELLLRYTHNYPGVIELESQLLDLLQRMRTAIELEIPEEQQRRRRFEKDKDRLIAALQESSVSQRMDQEKETNYNIYKQLYDDMKVKVEQARTNRELRDMGSEQFVIIDPPVVPTTPTKPNRKMIVLGGLLMGIMLGIVSTALAEMFDTTIRSQRDLASFNLPVIASIPVRRLNG